MFFPLENKDLSYVSRNSFTWWWPKNDQFTFVLKEKNQNWAVSFHFFLPRSYFYGSGSNIHFQSNVSIPFRRVSAHLHT